MFVVHETIVISAILKKTANFASYDTLDNFDLMIEEPDKTVAYDDDITGYGSATYTTTVTATVDGKITFSYTPATAGIHKISITTGIAQDYTILGQLSLFVVEPTTTVNMKVTLV